MGVHVSDFYRLQRMPRGQIDYVRPSQTHTQLSRTLTRFLVIQKNKPPDAPPLTASLEPRFTRFDRLLRSHSTPSGCAEAVPKWRRRSIAQWTHNKLKDNN